ncbi:LacI family transcriptional regulator [Alistipes sp. An116]|uniref:LacI family DNA-binding transcriptional regulator n=1 Tax=Alistipes sp. An116 TaxID=1965546 RepID=UPI000B36BC0B|nr:LacI family DNA-binding transcriptional regulator [Alistipes sp. An116]OUQ52854.1 LacI family transcriptional regulator [Alistipes sp. An116]
MGERTRKITIKDIAAEAGVSIALVSFVMNGKSDGKGGYRVNKETAERIRSVAERLNYQPNDAARMLRSGKTNTIGVIVSDISNKFFADIARCIEDRAYKHKYTVLFGSTDENPQKLENLIEVFRNKGIDGLIVVPCEGAEPTLRKLANENFPLVLLDREVPGADLSSVVLNNRRAGSQVTEVLVRQGFRRIEMVSYSMNLSNIREREEGYRSCMTENGLGEYVRIHHLRHERLERIVEVLRDAQTRQVEAFVFATNTLAMQGVTAMFRMGWQIPRDFSMACFDTNEAFDLYRTAAACVSQPIERFGAEALDLLIKSIEHRDQPMACTRIVLTPEIVEYDVDDIVETKVLVTE